jgi:hypothetical protein
LDSTKVPVTELRSEMSTDPPRASRREHLSDSLTAALTGLESALTSDLLKAIPMERL